MDYIFNRILLTFKNTENLNLDDDEFFIYDKFIDNEILNGNLIKVDPYHFVGVKFIQNINEKLSTNIIALDPYDSRIDMRCKGQAAYFLINDQIAILTFSTNAITFFPQK